MELSYRKIGDIYLVLDMRHNPPKIVGGIIPIPGIGMWKLCSFLKKGLNYQYPKNLFPEKFKTPERAWKWVKTHSVGWSSRRKYTIFNCLIGWAAHFPWTLTLIGDGRFHSLLLKLIMLVVFVYADTDAIPAILRIGCLVLLSILSLMDIGILINDRRPNRVDPSDRLNRLDS